MIQILLIPDHPTVARINQPYPGFVINQLGINHTGPVEHQPYPGFVMNQLASTILGQ